MAAILARCCVYERTRDLVADGGLLRWWRAQKARTTAAGLDEQALGTSVRWRRVECQAESRSVVNKERKRIQKREAAATTGSSPVVEAPVRRTRKVRRAPRVPRPGFPRGVGLCARSAGQFCSVCTIFWGEVKVLTYRKAQLRSTGGGFGVKLSLACGRRKLFEAVSSLIDRMIGGRKTI